MAQRVAFQCTRCGLAFEDSIDTVVSPSFRPSGPFLRAFWCPREEKFQVLNVNDLKFSGRCPDCDELLDLLADFPLRVCPRCHAASGRGSAGGSAAARMGTSRRGP